MPENYRLDDLSNLPVPDFVPLSRDDAHKLVRLIFEDWAAGRRFSSDRATPVTPKFVPRTEGRSGVAVLQLEFHGAAGPNRVIPKFILRVFDPGSRQDADEEFAKAERIKALDCEYFATDVKRFDPYPNVLCYGHAGNRTGEVLPALDAYLLDMLLAESEDLPRGVSAFARRLRHIVEEVTRRYDSLETGKVDFGRDYFERFRDGMPPDLWVVAPRGVKVYPERDGLNNVIAVKKSDDSIPAELDTVPELTDADQLLGVSTAAAEEGRWVRVKGTFRNLRYAAARSRQVCFMSGRVRVWLSLPPTVATPALEKVNYEIVFSTKEAHSGLARLQEMGFGEDALLGTDAFEKLCTDVGRIDRHPRHEDLHVGNVLASDHALKIIDVGGWDFDLPWSDVARLEVSLWYELAEKLRLDSQSARELLDALMKDREPERLLAPGVAGFLEVLRALRGGVKQYLQVRAKEGSVREEDALREKETALAYVAQILLYQRYALQDARPHIPEAFNALAVHWVKRLKKAVGVWEPVAGPSPGEPVLPPAPPPDEVAALPAPAQSVAPPPPQLVPAQPAAVPPPEPHAPVEAKPSTPQAAPTIFDLWKFALGPSEGPPAGKVRGFLDALAMGSMRTFLGNELKDLQMEIWKERGRSNPFQDSLDHHVILSGPTSSGKTTVAEMFLAVPTLLNGERTSAIYVAPTRALAQARYRELHTLFAGAAEFEKDAIVLSTGEDTDSDWRIAHGNFAIACMVYEKANIQFSRRSQLLRRIGCVVIDELHMLADLDRGPVLEVMLTKLLDERRRIDSETQDDGRDETIRIVAISTEDRPDGATRRFLSALDQAGTQEETIEPILIHTDRRPVTVAHTLVLPGIERRRLPYTDHKIVEFKDTDGRKLNAEQLADHENRLYEKMKEIRKSKDKTRQRDIQAEMQNRLIVFLLDQLRNDPRGYRVLVFMPGKDVRLPLQLKNERVKAMGAVNVNNLSIPEPIREALAKVEDRYLPNIITECARAAVFIHHADIPYKVREEIEKLCGRPVGPDEPSQVVFCTETLSYGVNLALNDVVILGAKFNSSSRWRRREVRPLPACNYHNMAGRAGRLSKTPRSKQAGVYVLVPSDGDPFANVVKRYYKDIPKLESRLFVTEDMEKQRENARDRASWLNGGVGPCAKFGSLKATDFSYPFVRSVLDVLRHLNYSRARESDPDNRRPVSVEDVRRFFVRTLFNHQTAPVSGKEDRKPEFFECAIRSIIPSCAQEPLLLVSQSSDHYVINDRGEAIIDTGTELRTVEPLLNIRRRVVTAWAECCGGRPFPTALYTLCLVSVEEIYRHYLRHTPEFRNRDDQESGAADGGEVFNDFVSALKRIEVAEAEKLARRLRDALEGDTDAGQVADAVSGAEDADAEPAARPDARGVVHAVVRFFNAMIGWILDDEEPVVIRQVVGPHKQNLPGFIQSREQLAWKTIFFAKMLVTAPRDPIRTEDQRELLTLASRFRHGCRAEAVRLFWPRNSDLTRVQASSVLIATHNRPATLLSATAPLEVDGVDAVKLDQLRADLRDHAVAQFSDLFQMLRVFQGGDERHTQLRVLLEEMQRRLFPDAVDQFPQSDREHIALDRRVREHLDFTTLGQKFLGTFPGERGTERYSVQIRIPKYSGVQLFGVKGRVQSEGKAPEEPAWDDDPTHAVTVLGVQFRHDWQASTGKDWKPFPDLLDQHKASHLVIVCAPWLPSFEAPNCAAVKQALARQAQDPEQTTTFVTPAAFGVLLVALAREYVGEPVMRRLTEAHAPGASFNAVNVRDVLKIIDTALATTGVRFPVGIRERLITHFEVEIEADGTGALAGVVP